MVATLHKKVRDVMSDEVFVVGQDAEVHDLQRLFLEKRIHGAPVVDGDGRLVGVVSQTDLLHWHHETGFDGTAFYDRPSVDLPGEDSASRLTVADIRTARVSDVMTPVVHAVGPDDDVAVAAERMQEASVHRLIVVDREGSVRGIVSAMDLLRLFPPPGDSG